MLPFRLTTSRLLVLEQKPNVRVVMTFQKKISGVTGAAIHLHPGDTGGVLTSLD